jgi:hypothetical protein
MRAYSVRHMYELVWGQGAACEPFAGRCCRVVTVTYEALVLATGQVALRAQI